jgi:hypothetical protein
MTTGRTPRRIFLTAKEKIRTKALDLSARRV